jgi:enoyl-CoA hydratase/carnithine racemase
MRPHTLDSYKDKYESISLERDTRGILKVTLHENNNPNESMDYRTPYGWTNPHCEWSHCFYDIARDYENEVVIITNAGENYLTEERSPYVGNAGNVGKEEPISANDWDPIFSNARWLQWNVLSIECPVIAAIKGAAHVHAEIALQSDIVLCSEDASFQDLPHFDGGLYGPGDGVQIYWPNTIGRTRGKYFLLTGEVLDSKRALELGVVNEVLPANKMLPRAYEHAANILKRPKLMRRYTRIMGTQVARKEVVEQLGFGLALEGLTVAGRQLNKP